MGRGLDFLYDPDLVMDPRTAYGIMSHCMRTGQGFANGACFSKYFIGGHTDYLGARDMVNAKSDHNEVANVAIRFEAVLRVAYRYVPTLMTHR